MSGLKNNNKDGKNKRSKVHKSSKLVYFCAVIWGIISASKEQQRHKQEKAETQYRKADAINNSNNQPG
jgi:hypothetical protein